MGVTHGKKKDSPETRLNGSAPVKQTDQTEQQQTDAERCSELQAPPCQLQSEEESSRLIRPQKSLNPLTASKSHRELHKELRMTHKRRVSQEGKSELQRALEKRRWEQGMKASRDQEEAKMNRSPLHQELQKRHQRLEKKIDIGGVWSVWWSIMLFCSQPAEGSVDTLHRSSLGSPGERHRTTARGARVHPSQRESEKDGSVGGKQVRQF